METRVFAVVRNPTGSMLRKFGVAMFFGFGVLGTVAWASQSFHDRSVGGLTWTGHWTQVASLCLWAFGVALGTISFGPRALARPVYVGWMTVTMAIGVVMSTILLTVLFVVLLPPFSLVVRLGDPLRKRLGHASSYWVPQKSHEPTMERMRRPF